MDITYIPDNEIDIFCKQIDAAYVGIELVSIESVSKGILVMIALPTGVCYFEIPPSSDEKGKPKRLGKSIRDFFSSDIVKICIDCRGKNNYLRKEYGLDLRHCIDLRDMAKSMRCPERSIRDLHRKFCEKDEEERLTTLEETAANAMKLIQIYKGMFDTVSITTKICHKCDRSKMDIYDEIADISDENISSN